jgi:hypothetical protein
VLNRVDDHLLAECAKWTGGTDLSIATSEGFSPAAHFEAQLEAFASIGLLESEEVEAWRRRFADAGRSEPVVVDDALRSRVERYLRSLLPAGAPTDEDDDQMSAAIEVLERLGLLSEDEGMQWFDRALQVDPDYEEGDDADDLPDYEGRELRRVLLGPLDEAGGVRVTSVELYEDAVMVRWSVSAGGRMDYDAEPELELSDDAGTDYGLIDGSSGSTSASEWVRGESTYVPGVPETATRLVVGGRVTFELGP